MAIDNPFNIRHCIQNVESNYQYRELGPRNGKKGDTVSQRSVKASLVSANPRRLSICVLRAKVKSLYFPPLFVISYSTMHTIEILLFFPEICQQPLVDIRNCFTRKKYINESRFKCLLPRWFVLTPGLFSQQFYTSLCSM